ncbi:MAG TPA: hypothetical protein VF618_01650 [Thermoanaerobaculia bacterium]
MWHWSVPAFLLFLAGSHATFVPWKPLRPGDEPAKGPLVLFWIPASHDDFRRSELLSSDELARYATHCVGLLVVRPEDEEMLERLEVEGVPAAVLLDGEGNEVDRVDAVEGALKTSSVEEMVREALDDRAAAAEAMLDDARTKAGAGEMEAAVDLYRTVKEQRCMCPRQAKEAQRALKKLGRR